MKFRNFVFFLTLALFISCQEETVDQITVNTDEMLYIDSILASNLMSVTAYPTTRDDTLDNQSYFSVQLPVTVSINNIPLYIATVEDLGFVNTILFGLNVGVNDIIFEFPITLTFQDYSQIIVNNQQEYDLYYNNTIGIPVTDCVEIVYPISFSLYNSAFQMMDTLDFDDDESVFHFLSNFSETYDINSTFLSINYPINLKYETEELTNAINNEELEDVIDQAQLNCVDNFTICAFSSLVACDHDSNDFAIFNLFDAFSECNISNDFEINFFENIDDAITSQNSISNPHFYESTAPKTVYASLVNSNMDQIILSLELIFDLNCLSFCSLEGLYNNLSECIWNISSDLDIINGETLEFLEDNVAQITDVNYNQVIGYWSVYEDINDQTVLVLDFPSPYEALSLEWIVTQCSETSLWVDKNDHYLNFEKECG